MKSLRLVRPRKIAAKLATPPTSLEASPHPDRASRSPLRGGAEYRDHEISRPQSQLQEAPPPPPPQQSREQLRDALRRYEELYNFAPISLITLNQRGMILGLNERTARLLAFPAEWLRERPFLAFIARHDVPSFLSLLTRLRRTPAQDEANLDLFIEKHVVPVELWIASSSRNNEVIYQLAILDVTKTRTIERELSETLGNWHSLVESAPDIIMTVDRNMRIIFINRHAWGYSVRALTGTLLTDYVPEKDRIKIEKCVAAAFEGCLGSVCEVARISRDDDRWYSFNFGPVQQSRKEFATTTVTIRDITKHKRTEASLRGSREQLRQFAARLDEVREEERKRVAREIHDELGQALTILKMDLAWVQGKTDNGMRKKIKSMVAEVDHTLEIVRKIVTDLRPSILDELGLSAAIEWQLSQFQDRTRIRGIFESNSDSLNLSRDVSAALFRVVQEALTNVMRHASASEVRIGVKTALDRLLIFITDNGKGVTRQQINDPQSFGIVGMKERVHRVGGQLNIYSSPGRGTRIEISAPTK